MTLNVSVNGTAVAAGGTYTAPTPGDQDVIFQITVAQGGVLTRVNGPWRFIVYVEGDEEPILDRTFNNTSIKFKKKFSAGTHTIIIGVSDEGLRGVRGVTSYEEIRIVLVIPGPPQLLVTIKSPEKNAFIQLKKNAKGDFYHDPVTFECEIKGGNPPFDVTWKDYSAWNAEIWPTIKPNIDIIMHAETDTRSRTISFSRGGEENPVPKPGTTLLQTFPSSLPPGEHTITVEVSDASRPRLKAQAKIKITVGAEPGKLLPTATGLGILHPATSARPIRPGGLVERAGPAAGGLLRFGMVSEKYGLRSPALMGAINQGKRELNRMVWYHARPLILQYEQDLREATQEWQKAAEKWMEARKEANKYARKQKFLSLPSLMSRLPFGSAATATNRMADALEKQKNDPEAQRLKANLQESFKLFQQAEDKLRKQLDKTERLSKDLREKFKSENLDIVDDLAKKLYVRHNLRGIPLPAGETQTDVKEYVKAQLDLELDKLIEYVLQRATTRFGRLRAVAHNALLGLSRRSQTLGDVWTGILYNLWNLIVGPWTIGTIFVIVQFYFMLAYIGYQPMLLFTMPIIGAIMMFVLNFESARYPLDFVTHASVGALLAQGIIIFMYFLGMTPNFLGWGWFWVIWFIFGLIGTFQFYFIGGHRVMFQMGMLVLLLGYIGLGPYKGYWELVKDQVRTPLYTMYLQAKNAVNDVWLLATNPTAWYAKQQVINVRPETPISYPIEIETPVFEAQPPSTPAGTAFSTFVVTKNSGKIDAKNIEIVYACNEWCDDRFVTPKKVTKLRLQPGESESFFFTSFIAKKAAEREVEFRRAKVFFNITYHYSTNSSLRVQVISDDELQRKFREKEEVFKPVLAVDKATSVKFSLNVGPQPLVYKNKSETGLPLGTTELAEKNKGQLLVSVSNRRPDGRILLKSEKKDKDGNIIEKASEIIINFPVSIGSNLDCNGQRGVKEQGKEVLRYKVLDDVEMKPYEFQTTFIFLCTFEIAAVETQRTDFVIAELPDYIFKLEKTLDIPLTPPIGILFDPDVPKCRQCGLGAGNICDAAECERISKDLGGNKCWFNGFLALNRCESCRSIYQDVACEIFHTQGQCEGEEAKEQCGLSCKWIPLAQLSNPTQQQTTEKGKCEKVEPVAPTGPVGGEPISAGASQEAVVRRIAEVSKSVGFSQDDAVWALKVAMTESSLAHCWDGTNNCGEDSQDKVKCGDNGSSCGLFQLNRDAHPQWYNPATAGCGGKIVYDIDCNIRVGVGHLRFLYNSYYNDPPSTYACKGVQYSGWEAVLRWYNGWPKSGCSGNPDYVEDVKNKDVSQEYLNIIDLIYKGAAFGDLNYCENKPKITSNAKCEIGQGGCKSDDECLFQKQEIKVNGEKKDLFPVCREPLDASGNTFGIKLCCWQKVQGFDIEGVDADTHCINKYNEWKSQIK